jgi:hypothetical protein
MAEQKTAIITGTLVKATHGASRYDDKVKYRLSIKLSDTDLTEFDAVYADTPKKLQPKWYKDETGYISLNSNFDIPTMDPKGSEVMLSDIMASDFTLIGAEVGVAVVLKDGAVYPKSIRIIAEGEPSDPFADFR